MNFNYVRRSCPYVSTFYHSEYITSERENSVMMGFLPENTDVSSVL